MNQSPRNVIVLGPGEGRSFHMGRIAAVFKADGSETAAGYSISEWWLDPHTAGPGAHSHPEDDIFYVIAGTMSVLAGDQWIHATPGSFVLIPGGVTHDFENRGEVRAGVLNFYTPGTFEEQMPSIARWYEQNPAKDAG
jgi:mannose-6-phosphate isomerase-like protein (cupin superfamily)